MSKRLIVGLGNPGSEYQATRHNVGFLVADALAQRARVDVTRLKEETLFGWGKWRGREFGIAKPQAYMNRSGVVLETFLRRWKLEPQEILVVVDDIHLPLGSIRIRPTGGSGGHNGIQDIIDWLDTQDFPRLRIGVGSEFEEGRQVDYVLAPFAAEEQEAVDDVVKRAVEASLTFVTDGVNMAMNRYNKG